MAHSPISITDRLVVTRENKAEYFQLLSLEAEQLYRFYAIGVRLEN
ncbi:hypothetical protein [Laspinema olomoucense]|uniref:Uncharacterized protein n=1 Tax=Laspinema olomoucense D3b TaxID=2953688 RepID=A0ABT2N753_9CYAN|nr:MULTISPECIES: hypothetical protein [unclassified Laspinema]MCT7974016.1 hypothetical protein [Laspinema sp. D3d]MCT7978422.1 hypothetical protein [Laspinema sp. D3b]